MKKLFIATGNAHKISEFKEILALNGLEFDIVCPKDFNDLDEPEENGSSYFENSLIKAQFYYNKYHLPTIADDSGIEIDFYDGKPGIYSARFLPGMNYKDKNDYILNEMKNASNRKAAFKCVVTYIEDGIVKQYLGVLNGNIADKQAGEMGFGYDPVFIAEGNTLTNAELGSDFKNIYSHRALALRKFADEYKNK